MWLWALLVIPVLIWLFTKRHSINSSWRSAVDLHLLTHLLVGNEGRRRFLPSVTLSIALVIAVIALAGPTWSKLPQSVYQAEVTRMIVLDLSRSMDVPDVKPSRLARAKFKVLDLLNTIKEGQVGLIVYADEPYIVSPLTEDAATIAAMVPTLITQLMPAQGSRLGLALLKVDQLFQQTGVKKGDIIVVTDGLTNVRGKNGAVEVAAALKNNGHRVSVLGIGTREGAPIPLLSGGLYKDKTGGIVIPKYDANRLRELAQSGGGIYTELSLDDTDIEKFLSLSDATRFLDSKKNQQTTDIWLDQGFWLLFILLPFALLVFRRGVLLLLCFVMLLPISKPSYAFEWRDLWLRKDQQAEKTMQENKYQEAAALFKNPNWKGAAQYRAHNYEEAIEQYSKNDTPEANYNLGNAMAKAGKIDGAIKAYNRVLDVNAEHEDALFNKSLLEKIQQDNQQHDQKNQQQSNQEDQSKKQQDQASSDSSKDQPNENKKNSQSSENKDSQGGDGENKNSNSGENGKAEENQRTGSTDSEKELDKEALQEALQEATEQTGQDKKNKSELNEKSNIKGKMTAEEQRNLNEKSQEIEQWLSKIKDDPGGLLRQKFIMEYKRRRAQTPQGSSSGEKW